MEFFTVTIIIYIAIFVLLLPSYWVLLQKEFHYKNNHTGGYGNLEQAFFLISQNGCHHKGGGTGPYAFGGRKNGRKGHYRQCYIGDIVKERPDKGCLYFLPDQGQGKDSDKIGNSGHD